MDTRMQAVERVATTTQLNEGRGGHSRTRAYDSEGAEFNGEDEFSQFRDETPRGVARREGGGRERIHEQGKNHGQEEDRNLGNIKFKIPTFLGKSDPEAYLQWEKKMDLIFDCHHYSEEKKVKLAITQFADYAITWWDQLVTNRRRNQMGTIDSWHELKSIMKKRFVPRYYHRELMQKLQILRQGSRSVEDYYKEMEMIMTRIDLDEREETTMACFLAGLNKEIADRVDLQPYEGIEEMIHLAVKIEKQLQGKTTVRYNFKPFSNPNSSWKKDGQVDGRKEFKRVAQNP